jgi:hypothetical protein
MIRKICMIATGLMLSACSHQNVAKREAYWRSEMDHHLPTGSSLTLAEEFFSQRGLRLVCCVDNLDGTKPKRYALERDVGRSLFMHYDVAILLETTPEENVSRVTVERWGIGL